MRSFCFQLLCDSFGIKNKELDQDLEFDGEFIASTEETLHVNSYVERNHFLYISIYIYMIQTIYLQFIFRIIVRPLGFSIK